MNATRKALNSVATNLDESMGVRNTEFNASLSPMADVKDAGRRPLRQFGKVEVCRVVPDPNQPRVEFSEESIERLAHSIREKGQLNPIRVRWADELQMWVIVCGERRWRAAQRADLKEIECYFHDSPLTPSEILEQQLVENCLREDLEPIEEAKAFAALMELHGWTAKALAEDLRISPSRVSRALALLRLPPDVQEKIEKGEMTPRTAYEISHVKNSTVQTALAQRAVSANFTVRQAAQAVRKHRGIAKPASRGTKQTFFSEGGWKVVVSAGKKGTYHDIADALRQALGEVLHRIEHNRQLF